MTWRRAGRALLAVIELRECDDYHDYDPGAGGIGLLDKACDVLRTIRDQCPVPEGEL